MVLLAGIMLLAPVGAFAAGMDATMDHKRGMHEGKGGKERFEKMFDTLGLTAEQKAKLDAGRAKHRDERKAVGDEKRSIKEALAAELDKPAIDMVKVKQLHEKLKALIASGEDRRLEMILEMRTILTPEQFAAFQKQMKEMRSKRHEKRREGQQDQDGPEEERE
jgi:Spy/CpxP family protein refolding chaperone